VKLQWLDTALLDGPHLILCLSEKQYLKVMTKYKIKNPSDWIIDGKNATCHTFVSFRNDGGSSTICAICIQQQDRMTYSKVAGLIVHEAVHVAQHFFEDIGETNPGNEIEAYIIQRIAQNLLFAYERQSKKNK
jgi:hypothetical protein